MGETLKQPDIQEQDSMTDRKLLKESPGKIDPKEQKVMRNLGDALKNKNQNSLREAGKVLHDTFLSPDTPSDIVLRSIHNVYQRHAHEFRTNNPKGKISFVGFIRRLGPEFTQLYQAKLLESGHYRDSSGKTITSVKEVDGIIGSKTSRAINRYVSSLETPRNPTVRQLATLSRENDGDVPANNPPSSKRLTAGVLGFNAVPSSTPPSEDPPSPPAPETEPISPSIPLAPETPPVPEPLPTPLPLPTPTLRPTPPSESPNPEPPLIPTTPETPPDQDIQNILLQMKNYKPGKNRPSLSSKEDQQTRDGEVTTGFGSHIEAMNVRNREKGMTYTTQNMSYYFGGAEKEGYPPNWRSLEKNFHKFIIDKDPFTDKPITFLGRVIRGGVNAYALPLLKAVEWEITQKQIMYQPRDTIGGYQFRGMVIKGVESNIPSSHIAGLSIDMDAYSNGAHYDGGATNRGDIPDEVVNEFAERGFVWAGVRTKGFSEFGDDPMHFQFALHPEDPLYMETINKSTVAKAYFDKMTLSKSNLFPPLRPKAHTV